MAATHGEDGQGGGRAGVVWGRGGPTGVGCHLGKVAHQCGGVQGVQQAAQPWNCQAWDPASHYMLVAGQEAVISSAGYREMALV